MEVKENKHVGIYGICKKREKILVIKKRRGPYKGLYDLPGGGIEFGENLEEALKREFMEEVNANIQNKGIIGNFDYSSLWDDDGVLTKTHHIGLYYEVSLLSSSIKEDGDGHDSEGALWLHTSEIEQSKISPIAYKALKMYLEDSL